MSKMLIIDTETGGLDPELHSILSVGAVVWEDGEIKDQIELMIVEPDIVADSEALNVNKIDLNELQRVGLPPGEAVARLHDFLQPHFSASEPKKRIPLGGHNIHFDVGFLKRLYRLAGMPFEPVFSHRLMDTAAIIRFLVLAKRLPLTGAGSAEAFAHFCIPFDPARRHTALEDAKCTALLLNKLIAVVSVP